MTFFSAQFVFLLPFYFLYRKFLFKGGEIIDRTMAVAFSFSAALLLVYFSYALSGRMITYAWLTLAIAAVSTYFIKRNACASSTSRTEILSLSFLLALGYSIWLAPSFFHTLPHGFDPFHNLLFIEQIMAKNRLIEDWLPYFDAPLNYPLGSHAWQAFFCTLLGKQPHEIYEQYFAIAGIMVALNLFTIARGFGAQALPALFTSALYLFATNGGGLGHLEWGGSPNLTGQFVLTLFFAFLTYQKSPRRVSRQWLWLAQLTITLFICHHHIFASFGLFVFFYSLYLFLQGKRTEAKEFFLSFATAALLGLPLFLNYFLRVIDLSKSRMSSYIEPLMGLRDNFLFIGPALFLWIILSAFLVTKEQRKWFFEQTFGFFLLFALSLYFLLDYIARPLIYFETGRDLCIFVPIRLLTNAIPFLCVFVGFSLGIFGKNRWERKKQNFTFVALMIISALATVPSYSKLFTNHAFTAANAAYRWIERNTPLKTVVINRDVYCAYLAKRRCSYLAVPASEYLQLFDLPVVKNALLAGQIPDYLNEYEIVLVSADSLDRKILQKVGDFFIYEIAAPKN